MQDFRSKQGLYALAGQPTSSSSSSSSLKGADLFSVQVFNSLATSLQFYRFMASLHTLSEAAQPTPTHKFLDLLSRKGKLRRVYTQNIDGLEERAGLVSAHPTSTSSTMTAKSKGKGKDKAAAGGPLVHLHGRASRVRCTVCTYSGPWASHITAAYASGSSVPCPECAERRDARIRTGRRANVAVGSLRPAITLYGEHGTDELAIGETADADMRSRPDCLIVFGTSLKVGDPPAGSGSVGAEKRQC